jgi:hypothetical protein
MAAAQWKNFGKPDEVREFPKGRVELINIGGATIGRAIDDGKEFDCKPGDVSLLPSGHDAWVIGNEPAVVVDFQGMIDYAKGTV